MKNILVRKTKSTAQSAPTNPYLDSRRVWNEAIGGALSQQRMWQIVAMIALLVALGAVGGVVYIGSQSRFVPYVVEVDKLGKVRAVAQAQTPGTPDERVVTSQVSQFVENLRTVSPDVALQKRSILQVYSMLQSGSPASVKTQAFYTSPTSNPLQRAQQETVSVQINSVLPQSAQTWQVEWLETTYMRSGERRGEPGAMRALLTVKHLPPSADTTEQQIRDNPLGVYVADYTWSKSL